MNMRKIELEELPDGNPIEDYTELMDFIERQVNQAFGVPNTKQSIKSQTSQIQYKALNGILKRKEVAYEITVLN